MSAVLNAFGQPIGAPLPNWTPPPPPPRQALAGQWCRLEPLLPDVHGEELFAATRGEGLEPTWTYLPYGPFPDRAAYQSWLDEAARPGDPLFYAIRDARSGRVQGLASFLRIQPASGSLEIGHLYFGPALQRTTAATEALYLLIAWAFAAGYRRCEWKCDALNEPSRRAAQRLGFSYEGTFRQATVYKGRNRDTVWYAILDREWPALKAVHEAWLAPANFAGDGHPAFRLSDLTLPLLAARG